MNEFPVPPPVRETGLVTQNRPVAQETFLLRLRLPTMARTILPGQFVMVRVPDRSDPLLARPLAMYDTAEDAAEGATALDLVYLVIGAGTRCLSTIEVGSTVEVWGPLGNTFPSVLPRPLWRHLVVVAGGVGQTPFLGVLKSLLGLRAYGGRSPSEPVLRPSEITFAWGVRAAGYFALLDDFRATGVNVLLATNDGSVGRRGYVTDRLDELLAGDRPPSAVFACGPEPMLHKVCAATLAAGIDTWVSLETKMACGYGVCYSCVAPVRENEDWDYARVCTSGPVFRAERIAWEQFAHAL